MNNRGDVHNDIVFSDEATRIMEGTDTPPDANDTPIEIEVAPPSFVVTITDAAPLTGLSVRTIQRRLDAGTLQALEVAGKRCARLTESDLAPGVPRDSLAKIHIENRGSNSVVSRDTTKPLVQGHQGDISALARVVSDDSDSETGLSFRFLEAIEAIAASSENARLSEKLFLTVPEAAQLAGVGKSAIESAIKAGYIKAHHGLGRGRRVKRETVEKWAKAL